MPVEVEKADIMLIPEMEMRDAVRISLPTLSDVFDDEPAAEADAKTEDEAPNEPAAESCGDPHHTPVTFMEVIRDGLMDRGVNPVLHTTPNDATMTIGGRTLLRATFWSGRADVLVPAFDDVKPRTCAGCRLCLLYTSTSPDRTPAAMHLRSSGRGPAPLVEADCVRFSTMWCLDSEIRFRPGNSPDGSQDNSDDSHRSTARSNRQSSHLH